MLEGESVEDARERILDDYKDPAFYEEFVNG